jgi:hypothetical protein
MGLGKSLGIGFVVYIVLNLVSSILFLLAVDGNIGEFFTGIGDYPLLWIAMLFTPVTLGVAPNQILNGLATGISGFDTDVMAAILTIIIPLLSGLILAIICGRLAENAKQGFLATMLVLLISSVIILVLLIINIKVMEPSISEAVAWALLIFGPANFANTIGQDWAIYIMIPLVGFFNGIFWGGFATLFGKGIDY